MKQVLLIFLLSFSFHAYAVNDWCLNNNNLPCGKTTREEALRDGRCTMNRYDQDRREIANQGGYVENTATVEQTRDGLENQPYIGINASICGGAWVLHNAQIFGNARVEGNARVYENVQVYGNAQVYENALLFGNAQVYGTAQVYGNPWVGGNAWVYGNAHVSGDAWVGGNAQVFGDVPHSNQNVQNDDKERETKVDLTHLRKIYPCHTLLEEAENEEIVMNQLEETKEADSFALDLVRETDGLTPFEIALNKNYGRIITKMIEQGADPLTLKNNRTGESLLLTALKQNKEGLLKGYLRDDKKQPAILKFLIDKKVSKDDLNKILTYFIHDQTPDSILNLLLRKNRTKEIVLSDQLNNKIKILRKGASFIGKLENLVMRNKEESCLKETTTTTTATLIKNVQNITCPVCQEESPTENMYRYQNCKCVDHGICGNCLSDTLKQAIRGGDLPAKCPGGCHHGTLSTQDLMNLKTVAELNDEEILLYRKNLALHELRQIPEVSFCTTPDCINATYKSKLEENHFNCELCDQENCVGCGFPHFGKNCEMAAKERKGDDAFHKLVHDPKSNIRPCAHCLVPTQKSEACDHMTCKNCNQKWDWRLGKISNAPLHYSKNDGSEPRTYRVPGDKNQRTGEEYTEYQENIENDLVPDEE